MVFLLTISDAREKRRLESISSILDEVLKSEELNREDLFRNRSSFSHRSNRDLCSDIENKLDILLSADNSWVVLRHYSSRQFDLSPEKVYKRLDKKINKLLAQKNGMYINLLKHYRQNLFFENTRLLDKMVEKVRQVRIYQLKMKQV